MPRAARVDRLPTVTSVQVDEVASELGLPHAEARSVVTAIDLLTLLAARHEQRCDGCPTCWKWRPKS